MSFENAFKSVLKTVNLVFGSPVTYKDSNDDVTEIKGVFGNDFVEQLGVATLSPTLKIRLADLALEPAEDDTVLVNSTTYKVLGSQPDSFGATTLILQKV
jgi:hypothetical protein